MKKMERNSIKKLDIMSDEEKQRLKDYQKNYREAKKLINSNT